MIAKDEIARLTAMLRDAFHANSSSTNTTQINTSMFCNNPSIIMDPVVVRTQGSHYVGGRSDGNDVNATMGSGQRPKQCSICRGVGHDAHNCIERERVRRVRGGASSSNNTIDHLQDSTQESLQSSDYM